MSQPLISIITINLNQAAGLQRTLQSIADQTWQGFELIVIDGASTDGSTGIMEKFSKIIGKKISEPDSGIYHAMNKGWKMASGKFCLFLNAGDCLHDKNVLQMVSEHVSATAALYYYGNIMGISTTGEKEITVFAEPVSLQYLFRWYLPHPASFISRHLLQQFNGFPRHYQIISDWIISVKAFLGGYAFYHLPFTVSDFYVDGISSTQLPLMGMEKKAVFENELSFLRHDWAWYLKMRKLELSRPVQWLGQLLSRLRR